MPFLIKTSFSDIRGERSYKKVFKQLNPIWKIARFKNYNIIILYLLYDE